MIGEKVVDKGKSYILITLIALFVLLIMTGCKGSVSPDVSSELDSASQDAVDAKPDSIETTDKPIASDQSSVDESIEVIETIEELEYDSGKTVEEERVGDFTLKYLFHNPLLDMEDHELTDENFVKLKGGYSRVFPFYSDKCTVQLVAIDYLEGTKIVFDIANRDNNDLVISGGNLYFSGGSGEKNVSGEVIIPSGTLKRVALSTNDVEVAEANISFGGLHLNYALERPKYYIQDTIPYTDNAYEYFNDRIELKGLYDIGGNGKVKCQILDLKLLQNKPSELFANEVMDDIGLAALLKLRLANTSGEDIKVNEISSLRTFKEVNARTYYIYDNELVKKWADFCLPMEIKADTIIDGYIPIILYHEHFAANSL